MFWLRMVFSLLQFFFVCASVVSYVSHVAYVSSLFVSHLFFGASEWLYYVTVTFSGYRHWYFSLSVIPPNTQRRNNVVTTSLQRSKDVPATLYVCWDMASQILVFITKWSKYSWLSLSRPRLSRITAYLEVKIWSLLKNENLITGNKILWKRGEIAPKEQFLLFSTIFSTYG